MATLELRPRSATEIIDASFQLMRGSFTSLVTLSVAAQLPVLVIKIWLARAGLSAATASEQIFSMIVPLVVAGLLLGLFALLAYCALTVATSQVYLGLEVNAGAALRRAVQRYVTVIATFVVLALGFAAAFGATAILPASVRVFAVVILVGIALIVGLRLIALKTVVVLEDVGPIEAIKRALFLGNGLVGHMFVCNFLAGIIYAGIGMVAGLAVAAMGSVISPLKDPGVGAVFQTAALALIYPLVVTISVVLYYDLRIRREGFDVEMMSRAVPR